MQESLFAARLIGPVLVVVGLTGMLNPKSFSDMAEQLVDNQALIFVAGIIALVIGLVIINTHNIWVVGWPVFLTIFGWICIVGGIIRIGFPALVQSIGHAMIGNIRLLQGLSFAQVILGALLMYAGYL